MIETLPPDNGAGRRRRRSLLRCLVLGVGLVGVATASYLFGLYSYPRAVWPANVLRGTAESARTVGTHDDYGRLVAYPGKIQRPCPTQTARTGVLLAIGQSNVANHAANRVTTRHGGRVLGFFAGSCQIAASPLLGATGDRGEFLTLLADRLVDDGIYDAVIIVSSGIGGSPISRWQRGGDLSSMMMATLDGLAARYRVTEVIWHQGESDFANATTSDAYATGFGSLVATLVESGIAAPVFTSVSTRCGAGWRAENPVARAQRRLADGKGIHVAADTDALLSPEDRYDECHFSESGQRKTALAYAGAIRRIRQLR